MTIYEKVVFVLNVNVTDADSSVQNKDGSWRIRMNYELNELMGNADIVRFIKSRIAWLGHVMWMDDKRAPKRILQWKLIGTRIRGRPRKRWNAGIEEDLHIIGVRRWGKQCEERTQWKKITVGCKASKRREDADSCLHCFFVDDDVFHLRESTELALSTA
jgi:hypothetical protein